MVDLEELLQILTDCKASSLIIYAKRNGLKKASKQVKNYLIGFLYKRYEEALRGEGRQEALRDLVAMGGTMPKFARGETITGRSIDIMPAVPYTKPKAYRISNLTDSGDIKYLRSYGRYTSTLCKDPDRLVVKRETVRHLLEDRIGKVITPAAFNQLVAMATLALPRQKFTIDSCSRLKYLLLEGDSAIWVFDWVLNNKHRLTEAEVKAEKAATYQQFNPKD